MAGVKSSRKVMQAKDQSPQETIDSLIAQSQEAKTKAYCPYSSFRVGAALLTLDNSVFTGKLCEILRP